MAPKSVFIVRVQCRDGLNWTIESLLEFAEKNRYKNTRKKKEEEGKDEQLVRKKDIGSKIY